MAIKFEKIQPGMTLWDVRKSSGLARFRSKWDIWSVYVKEVDPDKRQVLASWNSNPAEWMYERRVCKYRANRPKEER